MTYRTFFGVPVRGNINRVSGRKPQKTLGEFTPLFDAVYRDATVVSFGWTQYTPYFNDGDPCTFSAHSLWVQTDQDEFTEDTLENEDLLVEYAHPTLGSVSWRWEGTHPNRYRILESYTGPDQARFLRCLALSDAVCSGEFNDVLLNAFGDHCSVRVYKDHIEVEEYSHD